MDDWIPISALNQYTYCPRRCYLIHAEGEFEDNVHTLRGTHEHERVDRQRHEVSAGVRVEWARCDAVELHPDGTIYPVEYKHGKRRRWINDDLQIAAQALCLEEMLGRPVTKGAIYHQQSRRRRGVIVNEALRREVGTTVTAVRAMLSKSERPPLTDDPRRCPECSLREICQPDLARAERGIMALKAHLFEAEDESL